MATCGLRLLDKDKKTLNDMTIWNTQFCTFEKAEWSDLVEIGDGESIIGLTLGMAVVDSRKFSQLCEISYYLWDTPPK